MILHDKLFNIYVSDITNLDVSGLIVIYYANEKPLLCVPDDRQNTKKFMMCWCNPNNYLSVYNVYVK